MFVRALIVVTIVVAITVTLGLIVATTIITRVILTIAGTVLRTTMALNRRDAIRQLAHHIIGPTLSMVHGSPIILISSKQISIAYFDGIPALFGTIEHCSLIVYHLHQYFSITRISG